MVAAARSRATIGTVQADARVALDRAGVDSAALDARLLVAAALETTIEKIIAWPEREMPDEAMARLDELLRRRIAREPMSHLLGRREFWSLDFAVTADVLTPRPDSEALVLAVLGRVAERGRAFSILDLGTGSGCLLLALLSELPQARGVGVDLSDRALAVARRNATSLGLADRAEFVAGNWTDNLPGSFDIVIGNPPYIPTGELAALAPELGYEPKLALDGGADGLDPYRALLSDVRRVLKPQGLLALEIGRAQEDRVETLLHAAGLEPAGRHADLAGIVRCILAKPS